MRAIILALSLVVCQASWALEVSDVADVLVEEIGHFPLAQEEIGVSSGDFRTFRITLAPGATAALTSAAGDIAIVFVERGAVMESDRMLHAGQTMALEAGMALTVANDGPAVAVLLVADVAGVRR